MDRMNWIFYKEQVHTLWYEMQSLDAKANSKVSSILELNQSQSIKQKIESWNISK